MDWPTKREYLFKLSPMRAHDYLLKYLSLKPKGKQPEWAKKNNRLGLAAGFDVNAKSLFAWQEIGFGFVEVGTATLEPQPDAKLFVKRLTDADALLTRNFFPNDGVKKIVKRIASAKKRKLNIPVYLNVIAKDDPAKELEEIAALCAGKVDGLVVNIQNVHDLHEALPRIISKARDLDIYLKVGLDIDGPTFKKIASCSSQYDVKGVVFGNALPTKAGMISGKPVRNYAAIKIEMIKALCDRYYIPNVIVCGGIDDVESAKDMLDAGADYIQMYTGIVYNGFDIVKEIVEALNEYE